MSDLVPGRQIEAIVGVQRHPERHYARAVSAEQTVYILHSQKCLDSGIDLRDCAYSIALDKGIEHYIPWWGWRRVQDVPVPVDVFHGWLVPELRVVREAVSDDLP